MTPREPDAAAAGFASWSTVLAAAPGLSAKQRDVVALLRREPRLCAFSSIREVAEAAGVNTATVTRAAQALGFRGWTDLQREHRTRWVASLSVTEVADEHERLEPDASAAVAHDRDDLALVASSVAAADVRDLARRIAAAGQTLVVAQGSYAAVGLALAHNASIAGYDVRHVSDPAVIANAVAHLVAGDLLVAVNFWQTYRATLTSLASARARDVATVLITDLTRPRDDLSVDVQLAVPSESLAFFPSLVGALSVAQAVVVELATVDPERTRRALAAAGAQWEAFDLLRRG